jgi:phytoene synthase
LFTDLPAPILDPRDGATDGKCMDRTLLDALPAPQRLALSYAPSTTRAPTLALLALDARLGAALRQGGEPVLVQMRLAWWRDTLGSAPAGWPPGEPVLDLLRGWRNPAALVPLVDGWEALLGETLDAAAISAFAAGRADAFGQLARELDDDPHAAGTCARRWALADLAANLSDPAERTAVLEAAADLPPCPRLTRKLRPLAVLAGLARRSLARDGAPLLGGPGAMLLAVWLGFTGR